MKKILKKVSLVITTAIALSSVPVISASASETLIPSDYNSALTFYNTNGETAVAESGKEAVLVIPCLNTDKYGYVFEDEGEDYTADLSGKYYKTDAEGENGFCVYKISLTGNEDIDVNLEFSDLKNNSKEERGSDLTIWYDASEDGKFEVSPVPTTVAQAEAFLNNNGTIKISGKTAISVFDGISPRATLTEVKPDSSNPTGIQTPEKTTEADYSRDLSVANMGWYNDDIECKIGGCAITVCTYSFDDYGPYSLTIRKTIDNSLYTIYKYDFLNSEGSDVKIDLALVIEKGDCTSNGVVDLYDAIAIAKNMLGTLSFTTEQKEIGDIDNNGKIDLYDCIEVAKLILQKKK